jgi:hypothetical protein
MIGRRKVQAELFDVGNAYPFRAYVQERAG